MEKPTANLDALLRPRSVAVVGASANPDSPGHDYLRSLIDFGFAGPIYPVHPRESEILGLAVYPHLRDVPGDVEFVISCIPAGGVTGLLAACAEKGVRAVQLSPAASARPAARTPPSWSARCSVSRARRASG